MLEGVRKLHDYTVQIPIQPNILAWIGSSTGDGLPNDYDFNGVLHISIGTGSLVPIWYLDFNIQAEDAIWAMREALPIAHRFVHFVATFYNQGFKIDIPGIMAKRVDGQIEPLDHGHLSSSSTNLDEMVPLWNSFDEINDEKERERKELIRRGIEWIYLGKTMYDSRNTLIAYVTALEILLDQEKSGTVFTKEVRKKVDRQIGNILEQYIADKEQREQILQKIVERELEAQGEKLKQQVGDVLKHYIQDKDQLGYVLGRMMETEAEGRTARWHSILTDAKVPVTKKEINEITSVRGSTAHTGSSSRALPLQRAHEIATSYIKVLLSQPTI